MLRFFAAILYQDMLAIMDPVSQSVGPHNFCQEFYKKSAEYFDYFTLVN